MDVTPVIPQGRQVIDGYGGGGFRVAGVSYRGSVLVFLERTLAWPVSSFDELDSEALAPVRAARDEVDLLLVGCGPRLRPLPRALRDELRELGIVAECMDSGAASRTFNVLLAEERRVAAALIAVE